jgi:hypothetical protein
METVEVSRHPDGRRRFYGRLFRESGPPFVSERSANTGPKILKGFFIESCTEISIIFIAYTLIKQGWQFFLSGKWRKRREIPLGNGLGKKCC